VVKGRFFAPPAGRVNHNARSGRVARPGSLHTWPRSGPRIEILGCAGVPQRTLTTDPGTGGVWHRVAGKPDVCAPRCQTPGGLPAPASEPRL